MAYIGAFLRDDEVTRKMEQDCGECIPPYMKLVPKLHVTLAHCKTQPDAFKAGMAYLAEHGEKYECTVRVHGLVVTPRQAILEVVDMEPSRIECSNKIPHITLAVAPGVQPYESNLVLENIDRGLLGFVHIHLFKDDIMLKCEVKRE